MFGGLLRALPAKEGERLGARTQGCSLDALQENLKRGLDALPGRVRGLLPSCLGPCLRQVLRSGFPS